MDENDHFDYYNCRLSGHGTKYPGYCEKTLIKIFKIYENEYTNYKILQIFIMLSVNAYDRIAEW